MITPTAFSQLLKRNDKRIDDLVLRQPKIAIALESCCAKKPCGLLTCACCSEAKRIHYLNQIRQLVEVYEGPYNIANIIISSVPAGALAKADLRNGKDTLRRKLQRAGLSECLVVGGTEAGWSETHKTWILHIHALAIGVPEEMWDRVREGLGGSDVYAPLKCQELRDRDRQISYLLKFVTCHWPGEWSYGARGKAVPLHADRLAELAAWWSQYTFDDFPFLIGARRRGKDLVVEAEKRSEASEA